MRVLNFSKPKKDTDVHLGLWLRKIILANFNNLHSYFSKMGGVGSYLYQNLPGTEK